MRVLVHERAEQLVVVLEPRDEPLRGVHARALVLRRDLKEQLAQARQQVLFVRLGKALVVLQEPFSERSAEVQRLQHGVGVARVAEVLEAVIPLAVGDVTVDGLLQLRGAVPLRAWRGRRRVG